MEFFFSSFCPVSNSKPISVPDDLIGHGWAVQGGSFFFVSFREIIETPPKLPAPRLKRRLSPILRLIE